MMTRSVHLAASSRKHLWIVRHGQAVHNPRAEAAKVAGCSHEEFLELMRQDDALDANLTELGEEQARSLAQKQDFSNVDLVVSSPLSRALHTADLVAAPHRTNGAKRMSVEHFREVNGWLLNAKRRSRDDLYLRFPAWDFSELQSHDDELWTPMLESHEDCAKRGYEGFSWLLQRPEERILLVCHGGLLRFTMNLHEHVTVVDGRSETNGRKDVKGRFGNCEVRRYILSWCDDKDAKDQTVLESCRAIRLLETDV